MDFIKIVFMFFLRLFVFSCVLFTSGTVFLEADTKHSYITLMGSIGGIMSAFVVYILIPLRGKGKS